MSRFCLGARHALLNLESSAEYKVKSGAQIFHFLLFSFFAILNGRRSTAGAVRRRPFPGGPVITRHRGKKWWNRRERRVGFNARHERDILLEALYSYNFSQKKISPWRGALGVR